MKRPFPNIDFRVPKRKYVVVIGAGSSIRTRWNKVVKLSEKYCTIVSNPNPAGDELTQSANYSLFLDDVIYQERKHLCQNQIIVGKKVKWKGDPLSKKMLYLNYNADVKSNTIRIRGTGRISHYVANAGFAALLCAAFFRPKIIYLCGCDGPEFVDDEMFMSHYYENEPRILKVRRKIDRNGGYLKSIIKHFRKTGIKVVTTNPIMWGTDFSKYCIKL